MPELPEVETTRRGIAPHVLGKRVVAEGVETAEQRDVLVALGCDELQGFFFARPMAPEKLIDDEATAPVPFSPSTFVEA